MPRTIPSLVCLSLVTLLSSVAHSQDISCPKTLAAKPNWFHVFTPATPLTINFAFTPASIDCNGLPAEVTVPNKQPVKLHVTYPDGYSCTTALGETPVTAPANPTQDLIAAFAKAGVLPFAAPERAAPPREFTRDLPALSSVVMTATVTCKADKTTLIQSAKITYQNPPRVTASAGMVIAGGVRSYGVKTTVTGSSGGVDTTQNSVSITGFPAAQVVPFSFANIRYIGSRTTHFDFQLGFGVNPNLSTPKVEFFASPFALAWHDVYFSPGIHIGEHEVITNGFSLGQILPNGISKVPTNWAFGARFGFSLSYNLHSLVSGKS